MKLLAPYLSPQVATALDRETPAALDYSQRSCTELAMRISGQTSGTIGTSILTFGVELAFRCALSERQTEDLLGSEAMHRGPAVQSSIHVCRYTGLASQRDHSWGILLAADRLIRSDDAVATIALSLGYESESAFTKAF
jgi:hypothetical protein